METISAFEAKTRFGDLLARVARGEEIVITRHDKPVARVVPFGRPDPGTVRNAVAGLEELQRQIAARSRGKPKLTDEEVRSAIEAGRL